MFRVIIAGGREFTDYAALEQFVDHMLSQVNDEITVVSGTARGADRLGEQYARNRGMQIQQYPAQWDVHGKSAGYKRNALMADNADALIACWDGKSRGTKHMIDIARSKGLPVRILSY